MGRDEWKSPYAERNNVASQPKRRKIVSQFPTAGEVNRIRSAKGKKEWLYGLKLPGSKNFDSRKHRTRGKNNV